MSSYFVENGSYAKMRTLQLGYKLPTQLVKKLLLSSARVYLSGDNLLLIKSTDCPAVVLWHHVSCGYRCGNQHHST